MKGMTVLTFKHFVSADQVTPTDALTLIERAEAFKHGESRQFANPIYVSNLFFENSTRTHTSFEMAESKLGLSVISFDPTHSSVSKGETLSDTIKTLSAIGVNLAVIRHPQSDYYRPLLDASSTAILNAGDGAGQHPSQMMLDLMTIHEHFGHFTGLKVGIVGDLAHSRVARSDMTLLKQLGATVMFSGPRAWYTEDFAQAGPYVEIDDLMPQVDVLMLLRVQLERLDATTRAAFTATDYHQTYGVTLERAKQLQPQAIIMHPAPVNRDVELASELVESPQSRIFTQMHNGVFMRMAMLEAVIDANHF
nr:aspartate carbamoyltransferase catalytic subunit [Lacticaseibacillus brantae]